MMRNERFKKQSVNNGTGHSDGNNRPDGLYVHIPFCDGKCAYCSFFSELYQSNICDSFLKALEQETRLEPCAPETIYFGGGTPSILSPDQLERLCNLVCKNFDLSVLKEWTVEANPGSLTPEKLTVLKNAGVNRISIGCQSFNDDVLGFLGRRHTVRDSVEAIQMAFKYGFDNVSADLIACVPDFDDDVWKHTLETVVDLNIKHVSVYALTIEEGCALLERIKKKDFVLLDENDELAALSTAQETLEEAGLRRYEISNYAMPGRECLHNLACWQGHGYIGLGPGASSHIGMIRRTNTPDLAGYISAIAKGDKPPCFEETLEPDVKELEKIIFGLRMIRGISDNIPEKFSRILRRLEKQGLTMHENKQWRLTPAGLNLADYVAVELMP